MGPGPYESPCLSHLTPQALLGLKSSSESQGQASLPMAILLEIACQLGLALEWAKSLYSFVGKAAWYSRNMQTDMGLSPGSGYP